MAAEATDIVEQRQASFVYLSEFLTHVVCEHNSCFMFIILKRFAVQQQTNRTVATPGVREAIQSGGLRGHCLEIVALSLAFHFRRQK